jgi:HAD-superfamily hydrolase, subfamily IIB
MIKHIFSDMDGTLLDDECRISEKNISVIKQSQIPFTLVSARSPVQMSEIVDALGLDEPQIAFNGGVIFQETQNGRQILQENVVPLEDVRHIWQVLVNNLGSVNLSLFGANDWYVEKMDKYVEKEAKYGGQAPTMVDFVSLLKQPDLKIYKIMMITPDVSEMKTLNEKVSQLHLQGLNVLQSSETYLEITNQKAQKSLGVQYIQQLEHLEQSDMAAFGDGYNDISMLEEVGTPIVMENALPGVKDYGKYLTLDNNHDGVAYGIEKYLS